MSSFLRRFLFVEVVPEWRTIIFGYLYTTAYTWFKRQYRRKVKAIFVLETSLFERQVEFSFRLKGGDAEYWYRKNLFVR